MLVLPSRVKDFQDRKEGNDWMDIRLVNQPSVLCRDRHVGSCFHPLTFSVDSVALQIRLMLFSVLASI